MGDVFALTGAFVGMVLMTICTFFWLGLPAALLSIVISGRRKKPATLGTFSLSSVATLLEARTVYEFIQTLPDKAKAAAYNDIMSNLRKLLLDIKKHRAAYPDDIEELRPFVLSQIRYNVEKSPARTALESSKFRELAEVYCLTEVMQDIYMSDCKAARTKLPKGII